MFFFILAECLIMRKETAEKFEIEYSLCQSKKGSFTDLSQ